jgi:hypothetical protein
MDAIKVACRKNKLKNLKRERYLVRKDVRIGS